MPARITSISDRFGRKVRIDEPMSHLAIHETPAQGTAASTPIAVYTSYIVSPGDADLWIETWSGLARVAQTWPGCHSFRLLRDRNDAMFVAAISEWETMEAYASFLHQTQSLASRGSIGHVCVPGETRFLDVVPLSSPLDAAI